MDDPSDDITLPANLRWLRGLVTVLMIVMIVGMVLIVGILFVKMRNAPSASLPGLSAEFDLPSPAQSITFGDGWIGVVTQDAQFLVIDAQSHDVIQSVPLDLPRN